MRVRIPLVVLIVVALTSTLNVRAVEETGTTLAVDGRSNQTPWAAALGPFVAVVWGANAPESPSDVFVAVSRDGGRSFGAPVRVNAVEGEARLGGELPPRVALAPRPGAVDPEIVVAFGSKGDTTAIKVARSTDGGRRFTPGRVLQAPEAAGDRGWHALTLDAAGDAHVLWLDHRGLAAAAGTASHDHHEAAAMDGAAMAQRSSLYYARSAGAAGTRQEAEREIVKGVCYCCKVAVATAPDGSLFAAWRHVYPGNIRDIAFTVSRDGGRSFAAAGRVSEDGWELAGCPDDGPAMAVDAEGTVHLVWPTVLGGASPEGALFYAASRDGRAFSQRVRIPTLGSPKPMHPQILVDADERITVAWDEVLNGVRQAAVRTIRFDDAGQPSFGAASHLGTPDTPSSYPILVPTPRGPLAVYVEGQPRATKIRVAVP